MAKELWRSESWAKANLAKWEKLKAQGWKFKKADPMHRETGVAMWKEGRDHIANVYVKTNSDTSRQEVYESWVDSCEKIAVTSAIWTQSVGQTLKMHSTGRAGDGQSSIHGGHK